MIAAFFHLAAAAPVHGQVGPGEGQVMGLSAEGQGGRRLPCPCCVRRAEQHLMAAHRRLLSGLAVAELAALAVLGVSSARIMLIALAAIVVAAFAVLLVVARWRHRRGSAFADWRTWPPGYDPWADGDQVAGQHEGSAYRPGYGFLPGRGGGRLPRWRPVLRCSCQGIANFS